MRSSHWTGGVLLRACKRARNGARRKGASELEFLMLFMDASVTLFFGLPLNRSELLTHWSRRLLEPPTHRHTPNHPTAPPPGRRRYRHLHRPRGVCEHRAAVKASGGAGRTDVGRREPKAPIGWGWNRPRDPSTLRFEDDWGWVPGGRPNQRT